MLNLFFLFVLSLSAWASKARLMALGETEDLMGSFYISDNRNIFYNPAYIHDYKNGLYLETGSQGLGAAGSKEDADNSSQAEGGFLVERSRAVYGLHLGNEGYSNWDGRRYARLNTDEFFQDNQMDFFYGRDHGKIKWGWSPSYSHSHNSQLGQRQNSFALRHGLRIDNLEAFFNVPILNDSRMVSTNNSGTDEFRGRVGVEFGGNYRREKSTFYFMMRRGSWMQESDSPRVPNPGVAEGAAYTGKAHAKLQKIRLGVGREYPLDMNTNLFSKIEYLNSRTDFETADEGAASFTTIKLPVVIGIENDCNSWLSLRGSVSHNLWSQENNEYDDELLASTNLSVLVPGNLKKNGKRTLSNSTNINTGATVHFGNFSLDGLIGTSQANGNAGTSVTEKGIISLDKLMTRVALNYRF